MKKAGFTIIELLITIVILGIVGGIAVEVIIKTFRDNDRVQAEALVHRDLSSALDRFSRIARSATEILEVTPTTFKIRGYPNADDAEPSDILFYITSAGAVKYRVTTLSGGPMQVGQTNAVEYTLMGKVTNSVGDPLFHYFDQYNQELSVPITLASVRSVSIDLDALDTGGKIKTPISAETTVNLRNFKTNL